MNSTPEIFKVLRCPVTGTGLEAVDPENLQLWNRRIAEGQVDNRSGHTVSRQLEAAFINTDRSLMIPVHDGIIVMLDAELIPTAQAAIRPVDRTGE